MSNPTRGERNNNPGNIRHSTTMWQGQSSKQTDPAFVQFKSAQFGVRALVKTLLTYQVTHHLNTVDQIISRWAPTNENDTNAYQAAVANDMGVKRDETLSLDDADTMGSLVKAIIHHENGRQPYGENVINDALAMAGVANAKMKPKLAAKFVSLAAVGGTTVAQMSGPLKDAADQLTPFSAAPLIGKIATGLLTLAGVCLLFDIVQTKMKNHATGA